MLYERHEIDYSGMLLNTKYHVTLIVIGLTGLLKIVKNELVAVVRKIEEPESE
jgi:hypothetical protein